VEAEETIRFILEQQRLSAFWQAKADERFASIEGYLKEAAKSDAEAAEAD